MREFSQKHLNYKLIEMFQNTLLWMGLLCLYYIVHKFWHINAYKRFLFYAVDMIFTLCLMPNKLDWTMPYCLFLLMMSHWMHWVARQHVKTLHAKYATFKALNVLIALDVWLMWSYKNMLDDGSLKDRLTVEQALLILNTVTSMRIWQVTNALQGECKNCNRTIPRTQILFEAFELVCTIHIFLSYWPTVGLANLLYCVKSFSDAIVRVRLRVDARNAMEMASKKLEGHEIVGLECIICRETMKSTNKCGWVRLRCGHSYHTCCVTVWFNYQIFCPFCGCNVLSEPEPEPEPPETQGQLHHNSNYN
ncbi:E3 ubiquitin-protein ligase synoviolin B-like [Drosophila obscura]|uniref:E3 ubiquitin-protein ligase synoviolin B-like n=1 Tax=Drosophila obscura TaxID=7282 RepID=UPI001BB18236|nr:E3 ubiquitin-protein ligase synoviolin B-like [Drosophila obscura]